MEVMETAGHNGLAQRETDISGGRLYSAAHLIGRNKGYLNLWRVGRGFQGKCTSLG